MDSEVVAKKKSKKLVPTVQFEGDDQFISNGVVPVVTTYETSPVLTTEPIDSLVSSFEDRYKEKTDSLQKLEEKAQKAEAALEKEEKLRKEVEELNSKLLAEKTALLESLSGEKGALQEFQEKSAKLQAQKADLDNQLRVSTTATLVSTHF